MPLLTVSPFALLYGRLHPLLVHLPIGVLLLAALFVFLSRKDAASPLRAVVPVILFWGAIMAIFTCTAGYVLSTTENYNASLVGWHQWMGISVAVVSTIAWRIYSKDAFQTLQKPLMGALALLIVVTGHLGGELTHGTDYLTAPLYAMLGLKKPDTIAAIKKAPIADVQEAVVYMQLIQPILKEKCFSCHSAAKQKGGLRMDEPALLLKGGKHGTVLVAGDPAKSELVKRPLLPLDNDDHMAPKGKPQLTEPEIAVLQWWIQSGASMDKKVKEIPADDKMKAVLIGFQSGTAPSAAKLASEPEFPAEKITPAPESVLTPLRQKNVLVTLLGVDQGYLQVNAVNAVTFSDAQAELLAPLKNQLVWLKLGNTQISDAGLKTVGNLTNLTRLSLENTAVTDAGLASIARLPHLQYLNLYRTKVTDRGILQLAAAAKLKALYLWQTAVTTAGAEALKKVLLQTEINIGAPAVTTTANNIAPPKSSPKK